MSLTDDRRKNNLDLGWARLVKEVWVDADGSEKDFESDWKSEHCHNVVGDKECCCSQMTGCCCGDTSVENVSGTWALAECCCLVD